MSSSRDKSYAIFDTNGDILSHCKDASLPVPGAEVTSCAWHPGGASALLGFSNGQIRLQGFREAKEVDNLNLKLSMPGVSEGGPLPGHIGGEGEGVPVVCSAMHPGCMSLATASRDSVRLWSLRSDPPECGQEIRLNKVHEVRFDRTGKYMIVAAECVYIFANEGGKKDSRYVEVGRFLEHSEVVTAASLAKDNNFFCSVSMDRNLKFWE